MLGNSCVPERGFGGRKKVHSPPSVAKDRIYQTNGVKQGWILAPATDTIQLDIIRHAHKYFSWL